MMFRFLRQRGRDCLTLFLSNYDYLRMRNCVFFHSQTWRTSNQANEALQSGSWSVLFFGTDEFALHSFKILNERYRSGQLIKQLEVVTAYRGKENEVIRYANKNNIPVHSWPLNIPLNRFDVGLVVSFGHMIPPQIIDSFPLGLINVHASLLPKLRGAAPIIHALMNGYSQTGITIMKIMPHKFDVGEILAQEAINIDRDETMPELYIKLAKLGADLLIKTIGKLPDILSRGQKQNDSDATYAPKVAATASVIKWNEMNAKNVYDLQRALTGLYSLTTTFEDKKIKLLGIRVHEEPIIISNAKEKKPGYVMYDKHKNLLLIKCKDETWISTDQIIVPGRKPMSPRDFNNGFISRQKKSLILFD